MLSSDQPEGLLGQLQEYGGSSEIYNIVLLHQEGGEFCFVFIFFPFFKKFYFIFKLYNSVLVLPNIEMNPPQVYMCSPSWIHRH